jgi:MraZ protein
MLDGRFLTGCCLTPTGRLVLWAVVVTSGEIWRSTPIPPPHQTDQDGHGDVNMSLTGTYHRTLDEKQRLAVPKRLRDELFDEKDPVLFIAPETEQALTLYSTREFQRRAETVAQSLPQQASLRNYRRLYYSQAEQVEADSQGRIRLPERLVSFAGLTQEVVLLGVHDHVEIWDRHRWQQFLEHHASGFDTLSEAAFGAEPFDAVRSDTRPSDIAHIPR